LFKNKSCSKQNIDVVSPHSPAFAGPVQTIGIANLLNQVHELETKKGAGMNAIAIGEMGLGKRTFLNGLFGFRMFDTSTPPPLEMELSECEVVERGFAVRTRVAVFQTTWERDRETQTNEIVGYVNDQHARFLGPVPPAVCTPLADTRVHFCFFFVCPNTRKLSAANLSLLAKLAKLVTIIPVIGKADVLSEREAARLKQRVNKQLAEVIGSRSVYGDAKIAAGPFLVVGETSVQRKTRNGPNGRRSELVGGRDYPWGFVESREKTTSDFLAISALTIRTGFCGLVDACRRFHEEFRKDVLGTEQATSLLDSETHEIQWDELSASAEERVLHALGAMVVV